MAKEDKIERLKKELSKAILESDEYKEFKRLDALIDRNPDLRRGVDEFRRRVFEIVNNDDIEDAYTAMINLNNEFYLLRQEDLVNRYLTAEICFSSLVKDTLKTIVDPIDMELDFLR